MKNSDILICALGNVSYSAASYNFIGNEVHSSTPLMPSGGNSDNECENQKFFNFSGSAVMAHLIRQKCCPDVVVFIGTMQSNWQYAGSYLKHGFRNSVQESVIPDTPLFSENSDIAEAEGKKYFPEDSSSENDLEKLSSALNEELSGKLNVKFLIIPRFLNTDQDKAKFINDIKEQVIDKTEKNCNIRFHIDMSNGLRFLPVLTFLSLECLRLLDSSKISIKNIFCSEIISPSQKIFSKDRNTIKLRSLCNLAEQNPDAREAYDRIALLCSELEEIRNRNRNTAGKHNPNAIVQFNMKNLALCGELIKKTENLSRFRYSGELSNLYSYVSGKKAIQQADNGIYYESLGFYQKAKECFSDFRNAVSPENADIQRLIEDRLSWCGSSEFDLKKLVKMYYSINDYLHASLTMVRIIEDDSNKFKYGKIKQKLNCVNHLNSSEEHKSDFLNSLQKCIHDSLGGQDPEEQENCSVTLISFVGRDSYDLTQYKMQQSDGQTVMLSPMKFAGAGLAARLSENNSLKRLVLAGTASSAWYLASESLKECFKDASGEFHEILDILATYGDTAPGDNKKISEMPREDQEIINELGKSAAKSLGFEFQIVLLNDLMENTEQIAEKISEKIPENSSIFLDITHCFRYVPIIFTSVIFMLSFLRNKIQLKQIWYGDLEDADPVISRLTRNEFFRNKRETEKLSSQDDRNKAEAIIDEIEKILEPWPDEHGYVKGNLRSLSSISAVLYDALDIAKFKETNDLICLERILRNDFTDNPNLAECARQSSLYENLCCFKESYNAGMEIINFFRDPDKSEFMPPFIRVLYRDLQKYFQEIEKNQFSEDRVRFCIEKAKSALKKNRHRDLVRAIFFLYEAYKGIAAEVLDLDDMQMNYDEQGSEIYNWYSSELPELTYNNDGVSGHMYKLITFLRNGREHSQKENEAMKRTKTAIAKTGPEKFLKNFITEGIDIAEQLAEYYCNGTNNSGTD